MPVSWPPCCYLGSVHVAAATMLDVMQDIIIKIDRFREDVVPSRKRFAVTMYWLANGGHYKVVAKLFGMVKSTLCVILHDTIQGLDDVLFPRVVIWPSHHELQQIMIDMENEHHLPQCAGAIDGSFIHMPTPPGTFAEKYWCYKGGEHAIILLGICDARGRFTYVNVGQPATVGDAATFTRCKLLASIEEGFALPATLSKTIQGRHSSALVCPYIIGDSAFGLCSYMMRNYPDGSPQYTDEHAYNYCHIRTRRVIENAFGRLKNRFQILKLQSLRDPLWLSKVTRVCCALHNMCTTYNAFVDPSWFPDVDDIPESVEEQQHNAALRAADEQSGLDVRQILAQYVRDVKGCY